MSAVDAIIDALVAGGMKPSQAAALVARAGMELSASIPSKGALRTRKWRANRPSQSVTERHAVTEESRPDASSQSVTKRHGDVTGDIALSSSSFLEVTKVEVKEEEKKEPPKRKSGRSLPADWHPSESHYAIGQELSRTREHVDREAESMRLWATANSNRAVARKADWNATFTGWLRRTFTPLHQNPRDAQQQRSDDAYEQLRAFNRSRAANDRTDDRFLLENPREGAPDFHDGDDRADGDLPHMGHRAAAERH